MKQSHTFLFKEGYWMVSGEYFDQAGNRAPMEGSARITHSKQMWRSQGVMRLSSAGGEPLEIQNDYCISPFEEGRDFTGWNSDNPFLGRLTGLFVVVDDSIISTIASEDGLISGIEYLARVSDDHYKSRGFIFKGQEKLSSWAADLVRRVEGLH